MRMETARLILRPWEEADAQALYRYAKTRAWGRQRDGRRTPAWNIAGKSFARCSRGRKRTRWF